MLTGPFSSALRARRHQGEEDLAGRMGELPDTHSPGDTGKGDRSGGAIRRELIHRASFIASVLNPSGNYAVRKLLLGKTAP